MPFCHSAATPRRVSRANRKNHLGKQIGTASPCGTHPQNRRTPASGPYRPFPVLKFAVKAQAALQTIENCLPQGDGQEDRIACEVANWLCVSAFAKTQSSAEKYSN